MNVENRLELRLGRHVSRRRFLREATVGAAGITLAAAGLHGVRMEASQHEVSDPHPLLIDRDAPTFPGARISLKEDPERTFKDVHVALMMVTFHDQRDGLEGVRAGEFYPKLHKLLNAVLPFYNHFLGANLSHEILEHVYRAEKEYADYDAAKFVREVVENTRGTLPTYSNVYNIRAFVYALDRIPNYANWGCLHCASSDEAIKNRGGVWPDGGYIFLDSSLTVFPGYNTTGSATIAHEIGHGIGALEHNEDPRSIMYPITTSMIEEARMPRRMDRFDVAQIDPSAV